MEQTSEYVIASMFYGASGNSDVSITIGTSSTIDPGLLAKAACYLFAGSDTAVEAAKGGALGVTSAATIPVTSSTNAATWSPAVTTSTNVPEVTVAVDPVVLETLYTRPHDTSTYIICFEIKIPAWSTLDSASKN